ncbi:MAG: hypothetical protein EOM66_10760, partial [Clostridia bacterium]|nr:hypothetical protein [Clostridia bacterium]
MDAIDRILGLIQTSDITKNKMLTDLKLSKNSFVNWKKRGNVPPGDVLSQIADYFGVSVDYLLGRTEEKGTSPSEDELAPLLQEPYMREPYMREIYNELVRLSPETRKLILAQIEAVRADPVY